MVIGVNHPNRLGDVPRTLESVSELVEEIKAFNELRWQYLREAHRKAQQAIVEFLGE